MLIEILAIIGAICLIAFVGYVLVFAALLLYLGEFIDNAKYKYRYKHRFDKPPTAKCYCIDCGYHDNKNGRCSGLGEFTSGYKYTEDNWFCYNADPRKKEE